MPDGYVLDTTDPDVRKAMQTLAEMHRDFLASEGVELPIDWHDGVYLRRLAQALQKALGNEGACVETVPTTRRGEA